MRASDADRERAVSLLQAAFAESRLTRGEFGERIGGALTARTYADLATVTAGIPARMAAAPQRAAPVRNRLRPGHRAVTGGCALVATAAMMTDAALTGSKASPTANLFYVLFILAFIVAFISWLCAVSAHRGDAASGQPRPTPAPGRLRDATGQEAAAPARPVPRDDRPGPGPALASGAQ